MEIQFSDSSYQRSGLADQLHLLACLNTSRGSSFWHVRIGFIFHSCRGTACKWQKYLEVMSKKSYQMFNWNKRLTENSGRASNTGSSCAAKKKKNLSAHIHTYNHKPVNIHNVKECYQLRLKYYHFNPCWFYKGHHVFRDGNIGCKWKVNEINWEGLYGV